MSNKNEIEWDDNNEDYEEIEEEEEETTKAKDIIEPKFENINNNEINENIKKTAK